MIETLTFQRKIPVSRHRGPYTVTVTFLEVVQGHHLRYRHASLSVSPTLNVLGLIGFTLGPSNAGFMVGGQLTTSWRRTRELTTTTSPGTPTVTVHPAHPHTFLLLGWCCFGYHLPRSCHTLASVLRTTTQVNGEVGNSTSACSKTDEPIVT